MQQKKKNELRRTAKTEIAVVNRAISSVLLERRRKDLGIPEFRTMPLDDNVVVWRMPPLKVSPGGIIIPEDAQTPSLRGIVIGIGPKARRWADDNGIGLGHCVIFKRFAGWEHNYGVDSGGVAPMSQVDRKGMEICHLKPRDVLTSDDLFQDVEGGNVKFERNERGEYDTLVKATPDDVAEHKDKRRRKKIETLAKGTDNPHEAAAANRILNR